jgi:hypothetical protein
MIDSLRNRVLIILAALLTLGDRDVSSAEMSAEAVVTEHGLKRVGSVYILQAEAEVQKTLNQARLMSRQLNVLVEQAATGDPHTHRSVIQDLNDRINHLSAERKAVNRQLGQIPRDRLGRPLSNFAADQQSALRTYRDQVESELDQRILVRDTMSNRPPDGRLKKKLDDEVKSRRDKYLETVRALSQLVDATAKEYDELAKNPEIVKALATLGRSAHVKLKLGPSRDFVANRKHVSRLDATTTTFKAMDP